jgi:hypothetical protein
VCVCVYYWLSDDWASFNASLIDFPRFSSAGAFCSVPPRAIIWTFISRGGGFGSPNPGGRLTWITNGLSASFCAHPSRSLASSHACVLCVGRQPAVMSFWSWHAQNGNLAQRRACVPPDHNYLLRNAKQTLDDSPRRWKDTQCAHRNIKMLKASTSQ